MSKKSFLKCFQFIQSSCNFFPADSKRFFIDNEPSPGFVMTPEDRQKMNQRSNRFGKDAGAKTKKLSIDELLKAVSQKNTVVLHCTSMLVNFFLLCCCRTRWLMRMG